MGKCCLTPGSTLWSLGCLILPAQVGQQISTGNQLWSRRAIPRAVYLARRITFQLAAGSSTASPGLGAPTSTGFTSLGLLSVLMAFMSS